MYKYITVNNYQSIINFNPRFQLIKLTQISKQSICPYSAGFAKHCVWTHPVKCTVMQHIFTQPNQININWSCFTCDVKFKTRKYAHILPKRMPHNIQIEVL